jgi:hypothetical protein
MYDFWRWGCFFFRVSVTAIGIAGCGFCRRKRIT